MTATSPAPEERPLAALRPPPPSPAVQRLWFAAQRRPWTSLALLPADGCRSARPLASALAAVGRLAQAGDAELLDAEGTGLSDLPHHLAALEASRRRGGRLIVALDPLERTPAGLALARAADAVVLLLTLGESELDDARLALEQVGRERVVGCALFRPGGL